LAARQLRGAAWATTVEDFQGFKATCLNRANSSGTSEGFVAFTREGRRLRKRWTGERWAGDLLGVEPGCARYRCAVWVSDRLVGLWKSSEGGSGLSLDRTRLRRLRL